MEIFYKTVKSKDIFNPETVLTNGPLLWNRIISDVRRSGIGMFDKAGKKAIIAGGAVRDYLLGEGPRDIDVFVGVKTKQELSELGAKLGETYSLKMMDDEEAEDYERGTLESNGVVGVLDGFFHELWKTNVIGMNVDDLDGHELVKSFDFGVTRSWYGAKDGLAPKLYDTIEAATDRINDTATLLISENANRHARSIRRFSRYADSHRGHIRLVDNTEYAKKKSRLDLIDESLAEEF